jgi:hypothetical protein
VATQLWVLSPPLIPFAEMLRSGRYQMTAFSKPTTEIMLRDVVRHDGLRDVLHCFDVSASIRGSGLLCDATHLIKVTIECAPGQLAPEHGP